MQGIVDGFNDIFRISFKNFIYWTKVFEPYVKLEKQLLLSSTVVPK